MSLSRAGLFILSYRGNVAVLPKMVNGREIPVNKQCWRQALLYLYFVHIFTLVTHNRWSDSSLIQLNELRLAKLGSEKLDITQKQDINGQWTVMFHCNHNSPQETNKQQTPPPKQKTFLLGSYTLITISLWINFFFFTFCLFTHMTSCGSQISICKNPHIKLLDAIIKLTTLHIGDLIVTHRGGEMSGGLDVEQLLVDDLEVLSTPLAGARHRVMNWTTEALRSLINSVWLENRTLLLFLERLCKH